ncbi:hypothetical protein MMC18_002361 [Xylographa bjoerkii]|nr:hypothetical protein [Xylographa bjoerkii]
MLSHAIQEDGVLIVMQNSTVISLLVDTQSPTGWGEPQLVKVANSDNELTEVLDVMIDSTLTIFIQQAFKFFVVEQDCPLVDFRREFALGGQAAFQLFSDFVLDPGSVFTVTEGQAGAVFGTIVDGPTNALIETIMTNVISHQDSVRVSAIYQSTETTCFLSALATVLGPLANLTQTDAPVDIASAAITALGIVEFLDAKAQDAQDDDSLVKAVYALANTRHANATNSVIDLFQHSSLAVRVAAMRAVANIPTGHATGHLVYNILQNDAPLARKAGLEAIKYHQHEDLAYATKKLLQGLFDHRVQRLSGYLDGLKGYFKSRVDANRLDRRIVKIGADRVGLVQHAI